MSLTIQYTIVGLIIIVACVWVLVKTFGKSKKSSSGCHDKGCSGCAISEACTSAKKSNQKQKK